MSIVRALQSVESKIIDESLKVSSLSLGHECMKPEQHYAVVELLRGRDTFVSLPTGYGKSLIYQVLPVYATEILSRIPRLLRDEFHPLVVVLSPLVSLMQDQAKHLMERNISSTYLSRDVLESQSKCILAGKFSLVFTSPETLLEQRQGRKLLVSSFVQKNIITVAVDEAHCIVKW